MGDWETLQRMILERISMSENEIDRILQEETLQDFPKICNYIIKAGGKRIRPLLTIFACEAVKGNVKSALPISAAIEFAHTMALIQDDIFDSATLRRGVKPVHIAWGTPTALLTFDYLFLKTIDTILKTANSDINSQKLALQVLNVVVDAGMKAVEGEYLDLQLSEKENVTIEECLLVAEKKTGSMIEAALEVGAIIGGGNQEEINALKTYGKNLGIAYQIVDDMLGLLGCQSLVGKDIGADIANKRVTLVVAHALQNSSTQNKRKIIKIMKNHKHKPKTFGKILEETNSIGFAYKLVSEYAEKAIAELQPLAPTKAKDILKVIPTLIAERKW
jgi:geranylgeranyl diphosphate synthase type I